MTDSLCCSIVVVSSNVCSIVATPTRPFWINDASIFFIYQVAIKIPTMISIAPSIFLNHELGLAIYERRLVTALPQYATATNARAKPML